jgi:hypothetical protein
MTGHDAVRLKAICLTFDNLGEAAELEAGIWPPGKPVGNHASITDGLPWLLTALHTRPASFFVEGWSAETYPSSVRSIALAGKEVCLHGYRHEQWHSVASKERETLIRARKLLTDMGIDVFGFRPPGGPPSRDTFTVLSDLSFEYCSCLGKTSGVAGELPIVTYTWKCVDAFYLEPILGNLRLANGLSLEAASPSRFVPVVRSQVDTPVDRAGILVLVWHPYLLVNHEQRSAFLEVLEIVDRAGVPLVSCREAARLIKASALREVPPVLEAFVPSPLIGVSH